MTKVCAVCGVEKAFGEFHRDANCKGGVSPRCKVCACAASAAWRLAHPKPPKQPLLTDEERKARRKATLQKYNASDKGKAAQAAWDAAHPGGRKVLSRAHYEANATEYKKRAVIWNKANPEKFQAKTVAWKAAHPDKVRDMGQNRRALKAAAFVVPVDRVEIWERDGGICGICGTIANRTDYHIDHVIPITKGGAHEPANVQVAHPACNLWKSDRMPD